MLLNGVSTNRAKVRRKPGTGFDSAEKVGLMDKIGLLGMVHSKNILEMEHFACLPDGLETYLKFRENIVHSFGTEVT